MQVYEQWPAGASAQMNVTYTQANAGGGAIVCEISPGAGNEFSVMYGLAKNSGTNGITFFVETAIAGTKIVDWHNVASAAGTQLSISGGRSTTLGTTATDAFMGAAGLGSLISGAQALRIAQTGAGAQNDTFQILCVLRTRGGVPSVTHANSTNPANVSVTAGTEAFVEL